jgi:hypothetical protein
VEVEELTLEHLCDGDDGDVRVPHFFGGFVHVELHAE